MGGEYCNDGAGAAPPVSFFRGERPVECVFRKDIIARRECSWFVKDADQEMRLARPFFAGIGEGRAAGGAKPAPDSGRAGVKRGCIRQPTDLFVLKADPCGKGRAGRFPAAFAMAVRNEPWRAGSFKPDGAALAPALMFHRFVFHSALSI